MKIVENSCNLKTSNIDWYPASELVVDWSEELWVESALDIEDRFKQDFNNDGGIGLSEVAYQRVETDDSGLELFTLGEEEFVLLKKNKESSLL